VEFTPQECAIIAHALRQQIEDQDITAMRVMEQIAEMKKTNPNNPLIPSMLEDLAMLEANTALQVKLADEFEAEPV